MWKYRQACVVHIFGFSIVSLEWQWPTGAVIKFKLIKNPNNQLRLLLFAAFSRFAWRTQQQSWA